MWYFSINLKQLQFQVCIYVWAYTHIYIYRMHKYQYYHVQIYIHVCVCTALFLCHLDTNWNYLLCGSLIWRLALIRLTCVPVCGTFSGLVIDRKGPNSLWVASYLDRWSGIYKKANWASQGEQPNNRLHPWSLLCFLPWSLSVGTWRPNKYFFFKFLLVIVFITEVDSKFE